MDIKTEAEIVSRLTDGLDFHIDPPHMGRSYWVVSHHLSFFIHRIYIYNDKVRIETHNKLANYFYESFPFVNPDCFKKARGFFEERGQERDAHEENI